MKAPVHVAFVGGSGSGKTWLAEKITAALAPRAARISLDDFYRDLSPLPEAERGTVNFDEPAAIDWEKFQAVIGAMRVGENIGFPTGGALPFGPGCAEESFRRRERLGSVDRGRQRNDFRHSDQSGHGFPAGP